MTERGVVSEGSGVSLIEQPSGLDPRGGGGKEGGDSGGR